MIKGLDIGVLDEVNQVVKPSEEGPGDQYLLSFCPNTKFFNCFNGARCYTFCIFGETVSEMLGKLCCFCVPLLKQCMKKTSLEGTTVTGLEGSFI